LFNRVRRNLRGSILTAFALLLFLSFVLIGGAFQLVLRIVVRQNAVAELNEVQESYVDMSGFTMLVRHGMFGRRVNQFYINDQFELLYPHIATYESVEVAELLQLHNLSPGELNNRRLRTSGGIFYVTSLPAFSYTDWYAVFYVDVTDISRFSTRVNLLLLLLVAVIWAFAMIITTFLAGSLAWPLHNLNHFAQQIGRGDFSPNEATFRNEEFDTLNQSLNHAARQLAKYDNEQKTFFQNVSHELRTPLMSIKLYAEGINHGIMDAKDASTVILDATNRLTGMVGDILYVSRIDNITNPNRDEVNLIDLVEKRIRLHENPMQKGLITLRHDDSSVMISCIKSYIERALDNLISNALRYAESEIIVECHAADGRAVVRVIDDGPGFEPDSLPHVFERFYRGKNGLSGIGLAIVKSIIDQHNGTATAENKEKGAVLTISLPLASKK